MEVNYAVKELKIECVNTFRDERINEWYKLENARQRKGEIERNKKRKKGKRREKGDIEREKER